MSFVHDDPEFDGLLQIVAKNRGLGVALVEKDYWVTHTPMGSARAGLRHLVQGRHLSLSKGFSLIERFSEDLDLKLEPGTVAALRSVTNWKSEGTKATAERKSHFETLAHLLSVAGAKVNLGTTVDTSFRSATAAALRSPHSARARRRDARPEADRRTPFVDPRGLQPQGR